MKKNKIKMTIKTKKKKKKAETDDKVMRSFPKILKLILIKSW